MYNSTHLNIKLEKNMDINYFDIIASVIILLLGLKGIFNGFFKELFGLIGIIGGIFVASRMGEDVGVFLNNLIFHFESQPAVSFMGFLTTLAGFWLVMITLGYIFKKLSSMSGLGPIDRFFGFVFGAGKFFLIAAIIAFAVHNVKALQSSLDTLMKTSVLYPVLVETGGFIMKIDPTSLSEDINTSVNKTAQETQEKITQAITEKTAKKIDEIQKELKEK
jgi:membrane protein required for colicin V production